MRTLTDVPYGLLYSLYGNGHTRPPVPRERITRDLAALGYTDKAIAVELGYRSKRGAAKVARLLAQA